MAIMVRKKGPLQVAVPWSRPLDITIHTLGYSTQQWGKAAVADLPGLTYYYLPCRGIGTVYC